MSSALGQVQNPTNVSQSLPAEEPSGSNWVYRARIASQVALPVIMNTAFVLSMVGSIIFPPATVFLLVGIGVTAGLLWHLIPDPYAGLQGSSPQVDTPPDRPVPKNIGQLGDQQEKDKASLQAKQAQRRENVLKTYPAGVDKNRIIENLDALEGAENQRQDLEQEIERAQMFVQENLANIATRHQEEQDKAFEKSYLPRDREELFQRKKSERDNLRKELARTVKTKQEELAKIEGRLQEYELKHAYEVNLKELEKGQKAGRDGLEALLNAKNPEDECKEKLRYNLSRVEVVENEKLKAEQELKIAELQGGDESEIENINEKIDGLERLLESEKKDLDKLVSEIDPGLLAQMGTTFQTMRSMMGSAIETARGSSGVLFGAPGRVRDLLPSSSAMTSRLAPVGRWIGGVPGRIMGSLPSFDDARNSVVNGSRPYGYEDAADQLLRESQQTRHATSPSLIPSVPRQSRGGEAKYEEEFDDDDVDTEGTGLNSNVRELPGMSVADRAVWGGDSADESDSKTIIQLLPISEDEEEGGSNSTLGSRSEKKTGVFSDINVDYPTTNPPVAKWSLWDWFSFNRPQVMVGQSQNEHRDNPED
jgi:hypothetical protein